MALKIEIEKRLPGFTLEVAFSAGDGPVGILGASGAGKSMTLRAIAGIMTPTSGRISLDGRALFDSAAGICIASRARRIGLLFQQFALFPHMSVEENVGFGLQHCDSRERARRTADWIAAMQLTGVEQRYPGQLSGGQMQRVALARALAPEPAALLLDEPFSALDTYLRAQMERQLRETLLRYRRPTLLVSHNLEEIYRLCTEIVALEKGRVLARGSREEIFHRPPNRATAVLTGCKNFSRCRAREGRLLDALDWGCALRIAQEISGSPSHVAVRAHHVILRPAAPGAESQTGNVFSCWPADSSEGPFQATLYVKLGAPAANSSDYHLQVEMPRENAAALLAQQPPWQAELDPDRLMLLPD